MKTKMKSLLILAFLVLFLIPKTGRSQCNYSFNNGTGCTVSVKVEWYDGSPCVICSTQTQSCPPGGTIFTCSGCATICDVAVTVSGYATVDDGQYYVTTTTGPAPCGTSICPGNVEIIWGPSSTAFGCAP